MKLFGKIALIIITFCIITSCNGGKNLTDSTPVATYMPCFESGKSDNDFFRASANATSSNIGIAKEKAMAEAKALIAKQIIEEAKSAAERYATEKQITDKQTFIKTIELATNKTADIALKGLAPFCEKYSEANGRYTAYVSAEIGKQRIFEELNQQISNTIPNFDNKKFGTIFSSFDK